MGIGVKGEEVKEVKEIKEVKEVKTERRAKVRRNVIK